MEFDAAEHFSNDQGTSRLHGSSAPGECADCDASFHIQNEMDSAG